MAMPEKRVLPSWATLSRAASAACNTMNVLVSLPFASFRRPRWTSAGIVTGTAPPRLVDRAGRARSVGSASSSGMPARASRQNAAC